MNLDFLDEIGESAIKVFYENIKSPYPLAYGKTIRFIYENMPVRIDPECYLTPCEVSYRGFDSRDGQHHNTNAILNVFHSNGLEVNEYMIDVKKARFPEYAEKIDEICADLKQHFTKAIYTHSNPDIAFILKFGFNETKRKLREKIKNTPENTEEFYFLSALDDYCTGIEKYFETTKKALADYAEKAGGVWENIADAFANCFYTPAKSFLEGLLTVNFIWKADGCDSIGRIDCLLGELYEKDIKSNKIAREFASLLLDQLFVNFEKMNGWNMQIGGRINSTENCDNLLTEEILLCSARNKGLRRPNLALRVNKDTSAKIWDLAFRSINTGNGKPAIYNDDLYINLLKKNHPEILNEDLFDYGFGGCSETMICGMTNADSLAGSVNLAKALELALFDGVDMKTGKQFTARTGKFEDFRSFEDFACALKKQIVYINDDFTQFVDNDYKHRKNNCDPQLSRSLFTRDCIKNGKSFENGGARYNWSVVSYQGTTVLINSVNAIKYFCFDTDIIDKKNLTEALKDNFVGFENIQNVLKNYTKFGNDEEDFDKLGSAFVKFAFEDIMKRTIPRNNAKYVPSVILFSTYEAAGDWVIATPDGRNAFKPLNDSIGAMAGQDICGPTALVNSVLRLPLSLAYGTPVLNVRFHKKLFSSEENREKIRMLIENYFERGGLQIQISILDREALIKAQKEPENYRDLIVRIGGYSEYFVNLTKGLQDSVIERTEHL